MQDGWGTLCFIFLQFFEFPEPALPPSPGQRGSAWPWGALETQKTTKTLKQRVPQTILHYSFLGFLNLSLEN